MIKSDDEEKRLVYGIVYEPDTLDAHGDFTDAETIEKAAHEFMLK
ncbi:XkdF-like putative serine protease domain-containing protein, partial [Escherichia sp. R-CC3]